MLCLDDDDDNDNDDDDGDDGNEQFINLIHQSQSTSLFFKYMYM